jgi:hypothetical protein
VRSALSCAGAYVSGAAGSNDCPAGSVRIETEAACRTAAAAAGKTPAYSFVETYAAYPRGCYYFTSNNEAYFNADPVGAGGSGLQLLCAAVTTGAPLTRRCADARVCCAVLAGGASNNANGLNIHLYEYTHTSIHVCFRRRSPAVPRGARQRGRTADKRAGARHIRVLKQGYSKKGTHSSGETPSGACGSIRGKSVGSARQCVLGALGVRLVLADGSIYRVLTGYSQVVRHTHSRGTSWVPTLRGALTGGGGALARVQR